jgi:hypothetical protein
MKANTRTLTFTMTAAGIAFLLASGGALAAKGGNKTINTTGETETTAGNNLSYPAIKVDGAPVVPYFNPVNPVEGGLGITYSYGCEGGETIDGFSYPNTSCIGADGTYLTADQCTAVGAKCYDKTVDRIYWQKVLNQTWSSEISNANSNNGPVPVSYVDWGDSIEVVSWNETSVLRVETQPFADRGSATQLGFQMWHVSGQGTNEQWGVRVTEVNGEMGDPYLYRSPFAIINAGSANLYLSKLFPAAADDPDYACPTTNGDEATSYPDYYPFEFTWNGGGWEGAYNLPAVAYTIEQSVSGKYVHGYNWRMRELSNPLPYISSVEGTWQKSGWWRLTFVPNSGSYMNFNGEVNGGKGVVVTAPEVPGSIPVALDGIEGAPFPAVSGDVPDPEATLYTPVVDAGNNLTYIDICIVKKTSGGGGKTGGGKGGKQ